MKAWDFSVYIFVTIFLSVYVSQFTNRLGSFVDVVINSCENGAQIVDGKCDCSDLPFTGKNCQTSSCVNGGFHVYDTKSSQTITRTNTLWSCYCKYRYSGYNCEICNAAGENCDGKCVSGYYGSLCQNTCYANLTETTKFLSLGDGVHCSAAVNNGGTCTYCSGHGACNSVGACVCNEGFSGSTCDVECPKTAGVYCSGNGACSSGTCTCDSGFSGTACQYECKEKCSGVGVCTVDVDKALCACPDRYRGDYCQHLCPGVSVCSGRGLCDVNGTCSCETGWEGTACNCQASTTCSGHGACNPDGSCACDLNRVGSCDVCIPTFYGDGCNIQCKADVHCSGHGACNPQGTCNCDSGWAGTNCSACAPDVYPLAKYPNPCSFVVTSETCNNNGYANVNFGNTNFNAFLSVGIDAGKYMCTCNGNYSAKSFCKDCVQNHYTYQGAKCSRYCDDNTCKNGACAEDGTCSCSPGFFGDICDSSCSNVSGVICSGHGTCVGDKWITQQTTKCECEDGYEGSMCQLSAPTSSGNICNGRGVSTLTKVVHTGITFDCNVDKDCGDYNGNFNGSTMSVAMQTALKQALFGVVSSSKPYGPMCKRQMAPLNLQSIGGSVGTINIPEWTMSALTNGPFRMEVPGGFVYPLYTNQKYPTGIKIDGVQFYGPNTAARKYDCTEIATKYEAKEAECIWKDSGLCEYLMQEVDASKWCYERELYENKKCDKQFACTDIQFICTETCTYTSAQDAIDAWNAKHMETPFDGEDLIQSTFNLTSDMYLTGASVSECPEILQWEIPTRVYPSPRWWCQFGDTTWTTDNPDHQEKDECNEIDITIAGFGGFVVRGIKYNTFREAMEQVRDSDIIVYGQYHQYAETMTTDEMCAAYYNHSCPETWHSDSLANATFKHTKMFQYTFKLSDFSQGTYLTLSNSSGIMAAITHGQRLTIRNDNSVSGPLLTLGVSYTVLLEISDGVLTCSGEACPGSIAVSGLMTGVNGSEVGATMSSMHAFNDTECKESSWKLRKPPGWSSSKTIWALCNERHGMKIRSKSLCEYRAQLAGVTKSVLTRDQTLKCVRLRNNACTAHTIGTECARWVGFGSPAPCDMSKFTPGFNHKTPTIAKCENEAEWKTWCNSLKLSKSSAEQSLSGKCAIVQCDCDSNAYIGVAGSACSLSCPVNSETGTACGFRDPPAYSFGKCKEIDTAVGQHVTESTCECQRSTKINCEEKCDDGTAAKCNSGEYRREKIRSYDAWGFDDFISDGSLNIVPYDMCVKYLDYHRATEVINSGDSGICRWSENSITWGGTEGNLISQLITTKEECKKQNSDFELVMGTSTGEVGSPLVGELGIVYDRGHRTIVQKKKQSLYTISYECSNYISSATDCLNAFNELNASGVVSGHTQMILQCQSSCGLPSPISPAGCYIRADNTWLFNSNTASSSCENGCVCKSYAAKRLYDVDFKKSDTSALDMKPGTLVTVGSSIAEVYSSTTVLMSDAANADKLIYGGSESSLPVPTVYEMWITKTDKVVPIGSLFGSSVYEVSNGYLYTLGPTSGNLTFNLELVTSVYGHVYTLSSPVSGSVNGFPVKSVGNKIYSQYLEAGHSSVNIWSGNVVNLTGAVSETVSVVYQTLVVGDQIRGSGRYDVVSSNIVSGTPEGDLTLYSNRGSRNVVDVHRYEHQLCDYVSNSTVGDIIVLGSVEALVVDAGRVLTSGWSGPCLNVSRVTLDSDLVGLSKLEMYQGSDYEVLYYGGKVVTVVGTPSTGTCVFYTRVGTVLLSGVTTMKMSTFSGVGVLGEIKQVGRTGNVISVDPFRIVGSLTFANGPAVYGSIVNVPVSSIDVVTKITMPESLIFSGSIGGRELLGLEGKVAFVSGSLASGTHAVVVPMSEKSSKLGRKVYKYDVTLLTNVGDVVRQGTSVGVVSRTRASASVFKAQTSSTFVGASSSGCFNEPSYNPPACMRKCKNDITCNGVYVYKSSHASAGRCCYKSSWTSTTPDSNGDVYYLENRGVMLESTDVFGAGATTFGSPQVFNVSVTPSKAIYGAGSMCTVVNGVHVWNSSGVLAKKPEKHVGDCMDKPFILKEPVQGCPVGVIASASSCLSAASSLVDVTTVTTVSSTTEPPGCHIFVTPVGVRVLYFNTNSNPDMCDFSRRTDMDAKPYTDGCICQRSLTDFHVANETLGSGPGCYYNKTSVMRGKNIGNPISALVKSESECKAFVDYHVASQLTNEGGSVCSYNSTHVVWGSGSSGTIAGVPSGVLPLRISACSGGLCTCNPPNQAPFNRYTTSFTGARTKIIEMRYFGRHKRSNFMQGPQAYLINHVKYKNEPVTLENWKTIYDIWINSKNDFTCSNPGYARSGEACGSNIICTEQSEVCQTRTYGKMKGKQICVKGESNDEYIGEYTYTQCLTDGLQLSSLQGSSSYRGKYCMEECPSITEYGTPCSGNGRCSQTGQCSCDVASTMVKYTQNTRSVISNEAGKPLISFLGQESMTMEERTGWRGDGCEKKCPGYDAEKSDMRGICSENGRCNADVSCTCAIGFTGDNCQLDCPNTKNMKKTVCNGHGACQPTIFNASVSSNIAGSLQNWQNECNAVTYERAMVAVCDSPYVPIASSEECRQAADIIDNNNNGHLYGATPFTVLLEDRADRPPGCYQPWQLCVPQNDPNCVYPNQVNFNINAGNPGTVAAAYNTMCKKINTYTETNLETVTIAAVEPTLKFGTCVKKVTSFSQCELKVVESAIPYVSPIITSSSSVVPSGCSLQVLKNFGGNIGIKYYPHFNMQTSSAACQDGGDVQENDHTKFECICAEKTPLSVSKMKFYEDIYSTSTIYVDFSGKVVVTPFITPVIAKKRSLKYPVRIVGNTVQLVHTGKHRRGGSKCESTMVSNSDMIRPQITINRYMDENDTFKKYEASVVGSAVPIFPYVTASVEICKMQCLLNAKCNGFEYKNGVCRYVTSWGSVIDGQGDFYEISSCNKVLELTQTCDVLSKDNIMCAECACSEMNGFWGGIDCRTCKLGFGGLHCKKKCPGYDGVSPESICGGVGTCISGSKSADGEEFYEPSCVCGDNPFDSINYQQCDLHTRGTKKKVYSELTRDTCPAITSLEKCQEYGTAYGQTVTAVDSNWQPQGCFITSAGVITFNSRESGVECKSVATSSVCNDHIKYVDSCKRAAFELGKSYLEGSWTHIPHGCSYKYPDVYFNTLQSSTALSNSWSTGYVAVCGGNTCLCDTKYQHTGGTDTCSCKRGYSGFDCNRPTPTCLFGGVATNLNCKCEGTTFDNNQNCCPIGMKSTGSLKSGLPTYITDTMQFTTWALTPQRTKNYVELCKPIGPVPKNYKIQLGKTFLGDTSADIGCINELSYNPDACMDKCTNDPTCNAIYVYKSTDAAAGRCCYKKSWTGLTTNTRGDVYIARSKMPDSDIWDSYTTSAVDYKPCTGNGVVQDDGTCQCNEGEFYKQMEGYKCPISSKIVTEGGQSEVERCKNASQTHAAANGYSLNQVDGVYGSPTIYSSSNDPQGCYQYTNTANGYVQGGSLGNVVVYYNTYTGSVVPTFSCSQSGAAYAFVGCMCKRKWRNKFCSCHEAPIAKQNVYSKVNAIACEHPYRAISNSDDCKEAADLIDGESNGMLYGVVPFTVVIESRTDRPPGCYQPWQAVPHPNQVHFNHVNGNPGTGAGDYMTICYSSILMSSFNCPEGRCGDNSCVCPIGKYGVATCIDCPQGWYQDVEGSSDCKQCQVGKHNPYPTTQINYGQGGCWDCAPGYYQNLAAQNQCTACAGGGYQDLAGQTSCKSCSPGYFQDTSAQSLCKGCSPGFYQNNQGQNNCNGCAPGYYSNVWNQNAGCWYCPKGKYNNQNGQPICKTCPTGYFQDDTGQGHCKSCGTGWYSDGNRDAQSTCYCDIITPPYGNWNTCGYHSGAKCYEGAKRYAALNSVSIAGSVEVGYWTGSDPGDVNGCWISTGYQTSSGAYRVFLNTYNRPANACGPYGSGKYSICICPGDHGNDQCRLSTWANTPWCSGDWRTGYSCCAADNGDVCPSGYYYRGVWTSNGGPTGFICIGQYANTNYCDGASGPVTQHSSRI